MFLSSLISEVNDRSAVSALELALTTGGSVNVDMTLRDKFNEDLSCQVSVAAGCTATATDATAGRSVSGRFTVVTIRSTTRITDDSNAIDLMVQHPVLSTAANGTSADASAKASVESLQSKRAKSCDVPCAEEDAA
jgi:hypothetical protein